MIRYIVAVAAAVALLAPGGARAQGPGFSLQGQVGAGQTARDLKTSANWVYGAIGGIHFAGPLGLELDYQHAENDVTGTGGLAKLKQDGILGHVRVDFLRAPIVPFVYAGVGWSHYHGSALTSSVDRAVVPAGAGLELHASPLIFGVRGEYQWNTHTIADKHVDYWKAVGTVGLRLP